MRFIIEIWELGLGMAIIPHWTKWYLPIHFTREQYLDSERVTVSFLWIFHFSVAYPRKFSTKVAKQFIQNKKFSE